MGRNSGREEVKVGREGKGKRIKYNVILSKIHVSLPFRLDARKLFCMERVVRPWNRLLERGIKEHLENSLNNIL